MILRVDDEFRNNALIGRFGSPCANSITQVVKQGIVLTTFESEQDIHLALKSGARSYLLKDTPRPVLLETIRQVHRGETCIPAGSQASQLRLST
jgi:DNA-binding NarL/FixJ family response regulator